MLTRVLQEWEWPRLSETGCEVDRAWHETATNGCIVVVEVGRAIIATAFVFLTADNVTHVDGLWIDAVYRGRTVAARHLRRGIKYAVDQLGGSRAIPVDAAVWMRKPEHGIEL